METTYEMTIWFVSDTHFSHVNILKPDYADRARRMGWADPQEMNEGLIKNWNSRVQPNDEVYHLGDFFMGQSIHWEAILKRLNGRIHLIMGNHDKKFVKKEFVRDRMIWIKDYYELKVQDSSAANGKSQLLVLCHYPLYSWNHSGRGAIMCHGHSHSNIDFVNKTTTRIDVGVDAENWNYFPVSYAELKKIMSKRTYTAVDHHNDSKMQ